MWRLLNVPKQLIHDILELRGLKIIILRSGNRGNCPYSAVSENTFSSFKEPERSPIENRSSNIMLTKEQNTISFMVTFKTRGKAPHLTMAYTCQSSAVALDGSETAVIGGVLSRKQKQKP